ILSLGSSAVGRTIGFIQPYGSLNRIICPAKSFRRAISEVSQAGKQIHEEYIEQAQADYMRDGEIEIDDGAVVSRGSDQGAYVQAWVWVSDDSLPEGVGSENDADAPEEAPSIERR
ncbi:MAG TPA: hypothetical protein VE959_09480, partial [Bryobacteraceae bacterium]|nr:hypothetical protein [Bryobacteraceae bacterium]